MLICLDWVARSEFISRRACTREHRHGYTASIQWMETFEKRLSNIQIPSSPDGVVFITEAVAKYDMTTLDYAQFNASNETMSKK